MHHRNRIVHILLIGTIAGLLIWFTGVEATQGLFGRKPPIDGFKQIIPRGRIASIDNPEFVTAERAQMPDDAWILGFERDGQAYAYDLNLLNSHEIVNHRVGNTPIAAVW